MLVFCGGMYLLAQLGRDMGKRKEPGLWKSWGGAPTTRKLRHRDAPNKVTLARQHEKLAKLVPGTKIPTAEDERTNPAHADQVYESCVAILRDKTRDKQKFPLVFEENCNYGFRRNLWGMKPLGLTLAVIGTIVVAILISNRLWLQVPVTPLIVLFGLANVAALLLWLFWITPKWVLIPADAYAERLLETIDH